MVWDQIQKVKWCKQDLNVIWLDLANAYDFVSTSSLLMCFLQCTIMHLGLRSKLLKYLPFLLYNPGGLSSLAPFGEKTENDGIVMGCSISPIIIQTHYYPDCWQTDDQRRSATPCPIKLHGWFHYLPPDSWMHHQTHEKAWRTGWTGWNST